ncbi:uncharacterized protein LOC107369555 [Tetranychus urticae]|uniref:RING-type E3 ubiquitin transferase n=1 Tax=Tetranychus urticae TaxID=32264 RepID=T1L1Q3_TETUR|nr:uncharacterized protein LOC107369555 [Tetranychus urticae]
MADESPSKSSTTDNNCSEIACNNTNIDCFTEDPCYICLSNLISPCFADGCLHVFCTQCLLEWSKQSNRCPACRTIFNNLICNVIADHLYDEIPVVGPSWTSLLNVANYWDSMIESMVTNIQNVLNLTSPRGIISNYLDVPRPNHLLNGTVTSHPLLAISNEDANIIQSEPFSNLSDGWTLVRNRRNRRYRSQSTISSITTLDESIQDSSTDLNSNNQESESCD